MVERKEYKHWQPVRRKKVAMSGRRNPSLKKSRCLIECHEDEESSYFCEVTLFLTPFFPMFGKNRFDQMILCCICGRCLKQRCCFSGVMFSPHRASRLFYKLLVSAWSNPSLRKRSTADSAASTKDILLLRLDVSGEVWQRSFLWDPPTHLSTPPFLLLRHLWLNFTLITLSPAALTNSRVL